MTFDSISLNLVSGLLGAGFALAGARWLEGRKEKRQRATALNAVRVELALLASSVEYLVKEGKRNRIALRKPYWDKFSAEVTVSISEPLAKVLFIHMEDEFDKLQTAYGYWSTARLKTITKKFGRRLPCLPGQPRQTASRRNCIRKCTVGSTLGSLGVTSTARMTQSSCAWLRAWRREVRMRLKNGW